jgi:hypothetical protein
MTRFAKRDLIGPHHNVRRVICRHSWLNKLNERIGTMTVMLTENGAIAHGSTQDARLDLFFKTVRDLGGVPLVETADFEADETLLYELIERSWGVDPLDTMKILFNWRDCRNGKGDRHGFLMAMQYIDSNYNEWLTMNMEHIPTFGRFLDLVHLWYLVIPETKEVIMTALVKQLKQDLDSLNNNEQVSLLAKWIPSENGKWDRFVKGHPRFLVSFCQKLYGKIRVAPTDLKSFRKTYLVPLRAQIKIVESAMCAKAFNTIQYDRVPSVAMKRYRNAFQKNDEDRFKEYISLLVKGETKINASQVYPHELVRHYLNNGAYDEIIEQQWKVWKEKVDITGAFRNAISVVDVSGSMTGVPMEVAIALGLLSLNVTNKKQVITFSATPKLHKIPQTSLCDQVANIRAMDWGMNTDIDKVFNLLLTMEEVERVFIFSDMQFDEAKTNNSNFDAAKRLFAKNKRILPPVVFWNLRGSTDSFPVTTNEEGVIMLSGYSPNLLDSLLENKEFSALSLMLEIIRHPRYDCIKAYQ